MFLAEVTASFRAVGSAVESSYGASAKYEESSWCPPSFPTLKPMILSFLNHANRVLRSVWEDCRCDLPFGRWRGAQRRHDSFLHLLHGWSDRLSTTTSNFWMATRTSWCRQTAGTPTSRTAFLRAFDQCQAQVWLPTPKPQASLPFQANAPCSPLGNPFEDDFRLGST